MYKLLIFNKYGEQFVVQVTESGSAERTVWDERVHGPLPAYNQADFGGLVRSGNALVLDAAKKAIHDAIIAARQANIDDQAAEVAALRALKNSFAADMDAASTVAGVKAVMKDAFIKLLKIVARSV